MDSMERKIIFGKTGIDIEKKKINPKDLTPVHRTIIASRAMKKIVEERSVYTKLSEESLHFCKLSSVEINTIEMREKNIDPALPPAEVLIPDLFQDTKEIRTIF